MVKFDMNADKFKHNGSSAIKSTFLDSSSQNLSMIYNLFRFCRGLNFANDIICNHWDFKLAYFVVI